MLVLNIAVPLLHVENVLHPLFPFSSRTTRTESCPEACALHSINCFKNLSRS